MLPSPPDHSALPPLPAVAAPPSADTPSPSPHTKTHRFLLQFPLVSSSCYNFFNFFVPIFPENSLAGVTLLPFLAGEGVTLLLHLQRGRVTLLLQHLQCSDAALLQSYLPAARVLAKRPVNVYHLFPANINPIYKYIRHFFCNGLKTGVL